METENKNIPSCLDDCKSGDKPAAFACKLSTPEFQKRKRTILSNLKKQVTNRKELENGYIFSFAGSDKMLDELIDFIKTERECCDFFTFKLFIKGNKTDTQLELTGPPGAKDFISSELGL